MRLEKYTRRLTVPECVNKLYTILEKNIELRETRRLTVSEGVGKKDGNTGRGLKRDC